MPGSAFALFRRVSDRRTATPDMHHKDNETSLGGLAVSVVGC